MKKTTLVATVLVASQVAFSADWSFYGSARFTTFRDTWTGDGSENLDNTNAIGFQSNSRFGGKVSDTATKVSGQIEMGYGDGSAIVTRRLFGVWQATPDVSVLVGHEWSLINFNHSNQVWKSDNLMYGQGAFSESRVQQLRVTAYGASVAIVKGNYAAMSGYTVAADNPPKAEVAYSTKFGDVELGVGGGWNGYTVVSAAPKGKNKGEYDIQSFVAAADVGAKIDKIKVGASFGFAQNPWEYGLKTATPSICRVSPDAAGDLQNDMALIGNLVVSGTFGRFTPEVGVGMENHSKDKASGTIMAGYLQVGVALAKGVSFVPETGILTSSTDDGKTSVDDPTLVYFGAKSQINF